MVKRALLLLLGASTFSGIIHAETLTPEQALQRAQSLNATSMHKVAGKDVKREPAFTTYSANEPTSYVFTADQGWMIVSADDMAPAILGYSDNGIFDPENIPDNMRAWLEAYADQINWMRNNPSQYSPLEVSDETAEPRTDIAPMITTKWNQDSPFNDMTPRIDGAPTMTGCVATAMAQVMNYHQWPAVGTGTHSYTMSSNKYSPLYGLNLSIDFAEHPFDWANMADTYNANSTEAQKKAVADLMYTCGVSISSEYDTQATGALTSNLAMALMKYFDYNKSIGWAQRQYYKVDEWDELIYDQLKNYGPVLYGGVTSGGAGHQFVCDGYRTDGYFHINWGWGGLSDGYYLLSVMAPAMQGIGGSYAGYNFNQDAIINIKPAKADDEVEPWVCLGMINSFGINQETAGSKLGNRIWSTSQTTRFVNWGFENITTDIALIIEGKNKEGNDTIYTLSGTKGKDADRYNEVLKTYTKENNYTYFSSMIYGYLPDEMADGDYIIYPGYRLTKVGDKEIPEADRKWSKFSFCPSVVSYYVMTVNNGSVTFKPQEIGIPVVSNYSFDTPLYIGRTSVVKAKITNTTDTEFYGDLAGFFFADTATDSNPGSALYTAPANRLSIRPGETIDFEYAFQFKPQVGYTRDYKFAFVARPYTVGADSRTYYIISEMKVVSSEIAPYGSIEASSAVSTDGNVLCLPKDKLDFAMDVKCVEGTYYNTVDFWIYEFEEDEAEVTPDPETPENEDVVPATIEGETGTWVRKFVTYSPYLRLAEGQSQRVNIHINYDGEINKLYGLKAFSTWFAISDMIYFTLADNTSAFDYEVVSTDATPVAPSAGEDLSIPVNRLNFTTNVTVNKGSYAAPIDFLVYEKSGDEWLFHSSASSDKLELAEGESAEAAVSLDLPEGETVYGIRAYAGPYKLNDMLEFKVSEYSGVEDVVVESDAKVRYLNMQGIEVLKPAAGQVVIRVSGNRAEKVMIR